MNSRTFVYFAGMVIAGSFFPLETKADFHSGLQTTLPSNFPFQVDCVHSDYQDDELVQLWDSLSDIHNPTLEDYLKVENYLKHGSRPYLDTIFNQGIMKGWGFRDWTPAEPLDRTMVYAFRILQQMKFVGPNGEMPQMEVITLGGVPDEDKSRCIILYSSYNYDGTNGVTLYADKMRVIINDLEEQGYKGHVLFWTGGYPMIDRGGLYLAHVPYSFKILSIIEASLRGYQDVLWIDASMRPTNDLSDIFTIIENKGTYLVGNGLTVGYDYDYGIIPDETAKNCNVEIQTLHEIPHIIAGAIGISFRNEEQHDFLKQWYQLTVATLPAMSFYPEEFLLSLVAWRTQKPSTVYWWEFMNIRSHIPEKPQRSDKPFWNDKC